MKLPGRADGAVQGLASVDQELHLQAGRANQALAGVVGKVAEDVGDAATAYEVTNAQVDATNRLTEFRGNYGERDTFTADEVRKLGWDGAELTEQEVMPDGSTVDVDRQNIPAYEVYPAALEKFWRAETGRVSKSISRPAVRQGFIATQDRLLARSMEQEAGRAIQLKAAFEADKELAEIAEAHRTGNYAGGREMIRSSAALDANEKEEGLKQSGIHEEDRRYRDMANHGSDNDIIAEIKYLEGVLEDSPYEGNLEKDGRDKYIGLLERTLKGREAAAAKAEAEGVSEAWRQLVTARPEDRLGTLRNLTMPDGRPAMLAMDGKVLKQMMDYIDKGGNVETNFKSWYDLDQLRQNEPEKFAELSLWAYEGSISRADLMKLSKEQGKIKDGGPIALTEGSTWNQQKNKALEVLGYPTTGKDAKKYADEHYAFAKLVDNEMAIREEDKGGKLNTQERRAVLDDILVDQKVEFEGAIYGHNMRDATLRDIPVGDWNRSAEFLRQYSNDRVNDGNMLRMNKIVLALEKAGIPLTASNIRQGYRGLVEAENKRAQN